MLGVINILHAKSEENIQHFIIIVLFLVIILIHSKEKVSYCRKS